MYIFLKKVIFESYLYVLLSFFSVKRKIVQHGPSTLTISLPAQWAKECNLGKGDELSIERIGQGLLITSDHGIKLEEKRVNLHGVSSRTVDKAVAALYKRGYSSVILEYETPEQLEAIYGVLGKGCIGFEVLDDVKGEVHIRNVTEPTPDEFKSIFRRFFFFLLSVAEESVEAAKQGDVVAYQKLILRDESINKLSDFCRRMVNKRGQREYSCDTLIYHIIEQLEKIADEYKMINRYLLTTKITPSKKFIERYEETAKILREYEKIFFKFSLLDIDAFIEQCRDCSVQLQDEDVDPMLTGILRRIVSEMYSLTGATMALHL